MASEKSETGTTEVSGGENCEAKYLPNVPCTLPKGHAGLHFSAAWAVRWPDFVSDGGEHVS